MPRGTQALTGRVQLLEVLPFSQVELDGVHEDFLDHAFADPAALVVAGRPVTDREEYEQRVCRGGMPLAVHATDRQRANFYRSYLGASLTRDVLDLSRVRQINVLPTFAAPHYTVLIPSLDAVDAMAAAFGKLVRNPYSGV